MPPPDPNEWTPKYGDLPPRKDPSLGDDVVGAMVDLVKLAIWASGRFFAVPWVLMESLARWSDRATHDEPNGPSAETKPAGSGSEPIDVAGRFRYRDFDRLESGEAERDIAYVRAGCLGCFQAATAIVITVSIAAAVVAAAK